MTQEEKAKAYDEALKWMRELYPGLHGATKEDAEHYFPELRESEEDEKKIIFLERLIKYNVPDGQYGWADGRKGGFVTKSEAISMLKSLRPSWKPSEEQMEALMLAIEGKCPPTSYMSRRLEDLYDGLANTYGIDAKLD